MFHLQSVVVAATIGLCIIIQPCQSFFKQISTSITAFRPLYQFDSRQDVVVKSWSRKDAETTEFPKDQSVRKLLDMLNSRSISSREAKRSFESILSNWQDFHLSEIGWHRLLDGAIRWRYPSYAISSFEIMTEQGIVCPAYLMTSLLQLVCISGFQDVALSLFDSGVAAGLEPSVHCFSPLLKSCGTAQKARELLQRMEFVGIQANVISYTAAIKSCENTGDWRSALELLDLMRASGVTANEITYCCAINVASRGNAGDIAVNILREMLSLGFPPNLLCYGSALTGCAKVGMWHEVEILLEEMEAFGIPLQESVMISVLNVCRGQYPSSKTLDSSAPVDTYESAVKGDSDSSSSGRNDMRSKVTSCQWARTLWLIENYGLKATNVTESMYTMAMDVCESGGRYREVVTTYHMMMAHKIQPSKSSFSFALRACSYLRDGEQAVKVIRGAQLAGAATPFMYNSTIVLLDNMKRGDMALKVLRDILSIGLLPDATSSPSNSTSYPDEDEYYQGTPNTYLQTTRMRLPPGWLTRRIISNALQNLTENFAIYFTDVKNGRLSPSKELRPFVNDVAEVLKGTVHDRNLYLTTSAYPMANKILLDCGDFETLQMLLNHTLYKPEVNTTRLYDFALKSLLKENPSQLSIDVILLFVGDIVKASIPQYASSLLVDAMERLTLSKIKSPALLSDYPLLLSANMELEPGLQKGMIPKRGSDVNEIVRANLLFHLFEGGRRLLSSGVPKRAYMILAQAFKKANLPVMMLNLYRWAQEDNVDDRMLRNVIVFTLARSSEHWDIAVEILEDIRKKNGGTSDINMYYSALTACDSGKDWEQALYLLNRMEQDGHTLTSIAVTSVITACSASGQAEEALRLLQLMEDKDIPRTVWTYNAAISACAKKGHWKGALAVFEKMRENSMEVQDHLEDRTGPSGLQSLIDRNLRSNMDSNNGSEGSDGDDADQEELDDEDIEDDDEDEDKEEEGWDETLNPNFDVSLGTGDYELIEQSAEGVVEVGLFHAMRGVANQVTYNTLIEALGEGGQVILVDELYREAVENGIVSPLSDFKKGWIDLHGHSAHMAQAAIRYAFEYLLTLELSSDFDFDSVEIEQNETDIAGISDVSTLELGDTSRGDGPYSYNNNDVDMTMYTTDDPSNSDRNSDRNNDRNRNNKNASTSTKRTDLAVIVGKGTKLVAVIQKQLAEEFHPSVRSCVSKTNSGRLLLTECDIAKWLSIHKALR